jgi:hypothetical protein
VSADIWLEDAADNVIVFDDDPDAQKRDMIPMRVSGEVTSQNFNLTYNLNPMLAAAGLPPWKSLIDRPARDVAPLFRQAHAELLRLPDQFRAMNPPNGWGAYEDAVAVIGALADTCEAHPDATVRGWL